MDLEKEIESILFQIAKEVKVHKLVNDYFVVDIDYQKYVQQIMTLINKN